MPRRTPRNRWAALLFAAAAALAPASASAELPLHAGVVIADLEMAPLAVFIYRPPACAVSGFLVVLHGSDRNPEIYRGAARQLADARCLMIAAPLFDEQRFPPSRYQQGGLVDDGTVQPPERWTGRLILQLVDWLRSEDDRSQLPYFLLGHAAGAEFLDRFAAAVPNQASRIIIANPSSYLMPSLDDDAPYGFRGLDAPEQLLKQYLAQPITLLLGQKDTGGHHADRSAAAMKEGATPLERGRQAFHRAEATARLHGWPFGWRLVEIPGVGHSARAMFAAAATVNALDPSETR